MWHMYTMALQSAIKKNKIMSSTGKWMKLERTVLSEINQTQKHKYHMFSLSHTWKLERWEKRERDLMKIEGETIRIEGQDEGGEVGRGDIGD